jgi:hypothetical protein
MWKWKKRETLSKHVALDDDDGSDDNGSEVFDRDGVDDTPVVENSSSGQNEGNERGVEEQGQAASNTGTRRTKRVLPIALAGLATVALVSGLYAGLGRNNQSPLKIVSPVALFGDGDLSEMSLERA